MDYRVVGTLGSVFSAYLVGFGYPLSFVTHLSILHWTLLYLRPSYQSLTSFEPTYFIVLHDLIHFSCDQRRMQTSLELSGWVFTCLWTLGSTSPMMIGPIRLLMHLWWCTHIASRHVVSWFAYIPDLGSRSAFVWSIMLVLLCQHSFSDVWTRFSFCSLRLCISFSLHHHWAYPRVSCSVTFCVPCWLLSYTGAYPRSWVRRFSFADFLATHSISWPFWVVILGHTPILEFIDVLQTLPLLDLFLDLCESLYWGIPF